MNGSSDTNRKMTASASPMPTVFISGTACPFEECSTPPIAFPTALEPSPSLVGERMRGRRQK